MESKKSLSAREIRTNSGLTQVEFAKKLCITPEYLSMIEREVKPMTKKIHEKLLEVCETKQASNVYDRHETGPPNEALIRRIEALEIDVALLKKLCAK